MTTTPVTPEAPRESNTAVWLGLAAVAFLPIVVGWGLAPLLAEHPRSWRALRSSRAIHVMILTWFSLGALFAGRALFQGQWMAAALLWLAGTAPLGYTAARLRMSRIATAVSDGSADPRVADRWRWSIWTGRVADASRAVQREWPPSILGQVVNDDARDALTRWRDRRHRRAQAPSWTRDGSLVLPTKPPRSIILGGSGSGKSVLLRWIALSALAANWRVAVLDAKGAFSDAEELLAAARKGAHACVWWQGDAGHSPYIGWMGGHHAVVRKALALLPSDGPTYYQQRAQRALYAVAQRNCWHSVPDLLFRLRHPADFVLDRDTLLSLTAKQRGGVSDIEAVASDVEAALIGLDGSVDGQASGENGSWSWDDDHATPWDLAVMSVDTGRSQGAIAAAALIFADLNAYRVGRRTPDARPLLVIVDEAAAILDHPSSPDLSILMEQVRSQGIGLVVAAQSVAGLGVQGARLLTSGADLLAGLTRDTEEVVRLAGTHRVVEVGHQAVDRSLTGVTTSREQHAHRVDPERLRNAGAGLFCVSESGQPVRWVVVRPPGT